VTVRVAAVRPRFTRLDAPATVARRARRVTLRVASTVPATLRIGRLRRSVDQRTSRVTAPLRGRRRTVRLTVRLSSGRLSTRTAVTIRRR